MTLHDPSLGERKRHEKRKHLDWRCPNGHAGLSFEPLTHCPVAYCKAKLAKRKP